MSKFKWGKKCPGCYGSGVLGWHGSVREKGVPIYGGDACDRCSGYGRVKHAKGCWVCGEGPWAHDDPSRFDVHVYCLSMYTRQRDGIK